MEMKELEPTKVKAENTPKGVITLNACHRDIFARFSRA
jgi:hypothetical protein